jgi:pimeloyl-ACP methyl ester carboxylesterase
VVFPGAGREENRIGGTPARPDLHYTREVLQSAGLAVLEVWWDAGLLPVDDLDRWLDANASAALQAASQDYELALLAGRSLGTWALARLIERDERRARSFPSIWLAPLLDQPPVRRVLEQLASPAFVVGGTADATFDAVPAEKLRRGGVEVVVLEGANHGLEVDDPVESARLLADMLEQMRAFVSVRVQTP